MVARGADLHARDVTGRTVVHHAAGEHADDGVAAALALGATPGAADECGWTPLHASVHEVRDRGVESAARTIAVLLEHGADRGAWSTDAYGAAEIPPGTSPADLVPQLGLSRRDEASLRRLLR